MKSIVKILPTKKYEENHSSKLQQMLEFYAVL